MSADNWAICPKCEKDHRAAIVKLKLRAEQQYGQVSPEKYLELLRLSQNPLELKETLRENYCIQIDNKGIFYINYSCSCQECGFSHNFEHEEQLNI